MREKINRLARGIVDTDVLQVNVVPESVEEAIQAGELTKKELYVTDLQGRFIKGLVYSSNPRVRIHKEAFGGNRNHITYEIDGRNLSKDDVISGAFYLVTNGGERKVPFSFSVDIGVSGKVLDGLQTAGDLAELVHRDQELALRLFEYQDFTEAPFMQDLRVRALYDGLKGRPNRQNQLEEFLVIQGAKKPVSLSVDMRVRRYEGLSDIRMDLLEIKADTWGAVSIEVMAEGDFLELPRKSFERKDFKDQSCMVSFAINPGRLHRGKNLVVFPTGDNGADVLMRVAELVDPANHFQIKGIFIDLARGRRQNDADGAQTDALPLRCARLIAQLPGGTAHALLGFFAD